MESMIKRAHKVQQMRLQIWQSEVQYDDTSQSKSIR